MFFFNGNWCYSITLVFPWHEHIIPIFKEVGFLNTMLMPEGQVFLSSACLCSLIVFHMLYFSLFEPLERFYSLWLVLTPLGTNANANTVLEINMWQYLVVWSPNDIQICFLPHIFPLKMKLKLRNVTFQVCIITK